VVEFRNRKADDGGIAVEVASHRLGEALRPSDWKTVDALRGTTRAGLHVAAYGNEILYVRESAKTGEVLQSHDYGSTWTTLASIDKPHWRQRGRNVAVGPKGWAFVGSRSEGSSDMNPAQAKSAGKDAFSDVVSDEPFDPISFAFDAPRDKVFALCHQKWGVGVSLFEADIKDSVFRPIAALGKIPGEHPTLTADQTGTLRLLTYVRSAGAWLLERRRADGSKLDPLWVPLPDGQVAWAGSRALMTTHDKAFETADGGETWTRVPTSGVEGLQCTASGCVSAWSDESRNSIEADVISEGDVQRLAWDLPSYVDAEKVVASTDTPNSNGVTERFASDYTNAEITKVTLICRTEKAADSALKFGDRLMVDGRPGRPQWTALYVDPTTYAATVLEGRTGAVRKYSSLPPLSPKEQPGARGRGDSFVNGVGLVRQSNAGNQQFAWWSAASQKTQVYTPIRSLSQFEGPSADGRVLVTNDTNGDERIFLGDDGKQEIVSLPHRSKAGVARVANRWLGLGGTASNTTVNWSSDGRTWATTHWVLGLRDSSGKDEAETALSRMGGRPAIALLDEAKTEASFFGIDDATPVEPPAPTRVSTESDAVCASGVEGVRILQSDLSRKHHVDVRIDSRPAVQMEMRVAFVDPSGSCLGSYQTGLTRDGELNRASVVVSLDGKGGWSGWLFQPPATGPGSRLAAVPMSCKAEARR